MAQDEAEVRELRPFAVLPGGATPEPEDAAAAGILVGLALLIYLIRRATPHPDHVHTSAIDAVVVFAMVAIATALWRMLAAWLADEDRGEVANRIAAGMAFFT
jgi:hypothetical protein